MLGAIAGSIVGAAGDIGGAFLQNEFNKGRMKDQYMYAKQMYENRYQWQMEDMRKAGLNPMLSANIGAGGVANVGLPSSTAPMAGSSAVNAYKMNEANKLLRAEIKKKKAETSMLNHQSLSEFFRGAQEAERVHSAKAEAQLKQIEAALASKYGLGALARMLGTGESVVQRILKELHLSGDLGPKTKERTSGKSVVVPPQKDFGVRNVRPIDRQLRHLRR